MYRNLKDKIGTIIQLHVDEGDPSTFVVGRVLNLSDDWIILRLISTTGMWDGIGLFLASDIVSFEIGTKYIEKLTKLLTLKTLSEAPIVACAQDPLTTIIDYATSCQRIVALELNRSGQRDVIGYISGFGTYLTVNLIDDMGEQDGIQHIEIDSITRAYCGDADLCCLELLSKAGDNTLSSV